MSYLIKKAKDQVEYLKRMIDSKRRDIISYQDTAERITREIKDHEKVIEELQKDIHYLKYKVLYTEETNKGDI